MFNLTPEADFEHLNEIDVAIFNDTSVKKIPVIYVNGCSHACKQVRKRAGYVGVGVTGGRPS